MISTTPIPRPALTPRARRRAERSAHRTQARQELAITLLELGHLAADRLLQVIQSGMADAGYVAALRLALQVSGVLVERQRVDAVSEVRVVYAADAPGTLPPGWSAADDA
jgi:hypothetical protein